MINWFIFDLGNTIVVVEHDPEVMRSADHIVDLGPGAGENGGALAHYAVCHAGETAFPRTFQLLAEGDAVEVHHAGDLVGVVDLIYWPPRKMAILR